ncbi:MAG TPA: 5-methyltetrahydropteroyltriglutamate--homocysteine S-methyltransferase [Iamia sp.]|nr:5-methyltetrahydropteroyltriglutamate--homocysteine S-methyltransferase [Iamia sp.]
MPAPVTATLGFPRMGVGRELKRAVERYWKGDDDGQELGATAAELRARHWQLQVEAGIDRVPVGDFTLYDHALDTSLALGVVPARFGSTPFDPAAGDPADLDRYFALCRGADGHPPLEMTKWFDTNYHYLVPELAPDQTFTFSSTQVAAHLAEALAQGVPARAVVLGPVTFLALSKRTDGGEPLDLLDAVLPAYGDWVRSLVAAGATAIQVDEPLLVTDLSEAARAAYPPALATVRAAAPEAEITLATYFGDLGDATDLALGLPVDVVHVDLVRGADQLDRVLAALPSDTGLSLGLVDGRNIWRSDLAAVRPLLDRAVSRIGADRVQIAPSCSLLHLPVDLGRETGLDDELRSWLAFAVQRLDEVRILGTLAAGDRAAVADALAENTQAAVARRTSRRIHRPDVAERMASVTPAMAARPSPYEVRAKAQRDRLDLPLLPTTTIGSFPQTAEVRSIRSRHRRGELSEEAYVEALRAETEACVRAQEEVGLDVLVHGEFERRDMVEHFGLLLDGFTTTTNGWVQSYGSRCVKPPVIFGDVARPAPMTVEWSAFAAGLTDKPMKGMLTGPVTILQWSFVRDDQPLADTTRQIALALRDEVTDLIDAGLSVVQVDEPALREGLPLRRADHQDYLAWAVEAFRLAVGSAPDEVQIHTHMCYAEFGDILDAIVELDADVISMEASRSQMELLDDFAARDYPNEIGPGVWDIHSPLVPTDDDLDRLLAQATATFGRERLWVNPDCGLKTRGWPEVHASLERLVAAAARVRAATAGP